MPIPGINLYGLATQLIGKSAYIYFQFKERTEDDRGFDLAVYEDGVPGADSIQAVPRNLYQSMGLDWQKKYIMVYTDNPLLTTIERDTSGDQIEFNSRRFQLVSNNDWVPIDGWQGVLAVRLSNEVSP